jgi:tetratricopeptide (TPR) repeat protein
LKTAELEPTHPQIHYRIAQACWSDGDHRRAREHFLAELRTNPGDIDVLFDFSMFLLEVGDVEDAKEKFNRILELNPGFAPAVFYLGEIAFNNSEKTSVPRLRSETPCSGAGMTPQVSDYERAVKLFDEALRKDGCLPGPRYRLAQCALIEGHSRQAKAYLASEVKLAPENVDVLLSMASMFLAVGDTDFGINCLLRATDIEPACADAYYYLGLASIQKGRFSEAAEFFGHALDIKADHICALRASAELYLKMGKLDEAEERINKAIGCASMDSTLRQSSVQIGSPQKDAHLKAIRRKVQLARIIQRIADFLSRFSPRFGSYPNFLIARFVRRR